MLSRRQVEISRGPVLKSIAAVGIFAAGCAGFALATGIQLSFTSSPLWPVSIGFGLGAMVVLYRADTTKWRPRSDGSILAKSLRKLVLGVLACTFAISGVDYLLHPGPVHWMRSFSTAATYVVIALLLDLLLVGLPAWMTRRRGD